MTVIASFAAAFGAGVIVSDLVFGFAGVETTLPLIAFIFLVALGVDYNIFLVARAREEALKHGSDEGMLRALAATGAVITSAGIVLAGTFSILALIPFVALVEPVSHRPAASLGSGNQRMRSSSGGRTGSTGVARTPRMIRRASSSWPASARSGAVASAARPSSSRGSASARASAWCQRPVTGSKR